MGETMESLPHDVHYQCAATTIANKYNLPGVFYLDLWPAACGQVVVTDPDVALHMTVTKNHPKHEAEKWFVDPLIGAGNIVTTEGAEWKYLSVPSQSRPRWTTDLMSLDIRCSLPLLLYSILATCAPWQAYPVLTKGIDLCLQDKIAEELMEFRSILREKAESGEKFSLEEITLHTTFDVIGKATFGHSLNAKRQGSPALDHWEAMSRAFAKTRETWNFIAIFLSKRVVKAETKKLDVILCDMIQNRFNLLIRDKADLRNKKGLGIMDLILRDYIEEIRQTGKQRLDRKFLGTALCQVKTLLIAGTGTTSDVICYTIMM